MRRRNPTKPKVPVNRVLTKLPFVSKTRLLLPRIEKFIQKGRLSSRAMKLKALASYLRGQGVGEHEIEWFFGGIDPDTSKPWEEWRQIIFSRGDSLKADLRGMMRGVASGPLPPDVAWWDDEFARGFVVRSQSYLNEHKLKSGALAHFISVVSLTNAAPPGDAILHYRGDEQILHLRFQLRAQPFINGTETKIILYLDELQSDRHEQAVTRGYQKQQATTLPPDTEIVPFTHFPDPRALAVRLYPKWGTDAGNFSDLFRKHFGSKSKQSAAFKRYVQGKEPADETEAVIWDWWRAEDHFLAFLEKHQSVVVAESERGHTLEPDPKPAALMAPLVVKHFRKLGMKPAAPKLRPADVQGEARYKYRLPGRDVSTTHFSSVKLAERAALKAWNNMQESGVGWAPWPEASQYAKLGLKLLLYFAVQMGCDGLALTTGAQQVMIYSSDAAEVAVVIPGEAPMTVTWMDNDTPRLHYFDLSGREQTIFIRDTDKQFHPSLQKAISAAAKRKVAGATVNLPRGLYPMRQGRTGMGQFYDDTLPRVLAKIVQPFGGKVVPLIETPVQIGGTYWRTADVGAINPGVKINERMRQEFEERTSKTFEDYALLFNPPRQGCR